MNHAPYTIHHTPYTGARAPPLPPPKEGLTLRPQKTAHAHEHLDNLNNLLGSPLMDGCAHGYALGTVQCSAVQSISHQKRIHRAHVCK